MIRPLAHSRVSVSPLTSHRRTMPPARSHVSPKPLIHRSGGTGFSSVTTPRQLADRHTLTVMSHSSPVMRHQVSEETPKEQRTTDVCRAAAAATKSVVPSLISPTASTRASSCMSSPRFKRVASTQPPDVHDFTEPSMPRKQLLQARFRKTCQQLQRQQDMAKMLLQRMETEREWRISLEDALVESCLCGCCKQGNCQTYDP